MTVRDPFGHNEPPFANKPEHQSEPRSLIDSWPFLVCGLVAVCALLWGVAQGWIV